VRIATLIALICLFAISTTALAEDKWPDDYVPGVPFDGGREGGDTIEAATAIAALPFSDTGNTCGFVNDYDEVCPYTGSTSPDVVYSLATGSDCVIDITLCNGSAYDTKLYVYEDTWTPGNPYACNDDYCTGYVSQIDALALGGGHTYFIVVDGYYGDCGDYIIDIVGDCGATAAESNTWGSIKSLYR